MSRTHRLTARGLTARGLTTVAAGAALVAGALVAPAQAAASADPQPAKDAGSWIAGQTTKGLVHNDQYSFDDYGLTIDVGLGLDAAGQQPGTVKQITKALAKNGGAYTGFGSSVYAGATAKLLFFALGQGKDPKTYSDVNLLERLEGRVASAAPISGRVEDAFDPADPYGADYANVIGQAYAAAALSQAKSPRAASATSFLLLQQCKAGFFRLGFNADKTAADQSCDGAAKADRSPDTDATAIAVIALSELKATSATKKAVKQAVAWLGKKQKADGSFGGGTSTEAPNANSTGLAGWALGVSGDDARAAKAATWLRTYQVAAKNPCLVKLKTQVGAVAYDLTAYETARTKGIRTKDADQWRRASAQALPALQWAPKGVGALKASGPASVAAGSSFKVTLTGAAPGQRACVVSGGESAEYVPGRKALSKLTVTAPEATGQQVVSVWVGGTRLAVPVRVTG